MIKDKVPDRVKTVYRDVRKRFLDPTNNPIMSRAYGDSLTIAHKDVEMVFDTSSPVAKRWFYPRYRDGSLHEPAVSKTLFECLDSESIFLDVGANVGFYSVLAAQIASEVHSFEMDPRLAGVVGSHFEKDPSIESTVNVVPAAVSDTSGDFVSFSPHITDNLSTNTIVSEGEKLSNFQVPTVALDDYVEQKDITPDVMKIDVEGAEMAVLQGMSNTLETRVQTLFLEVHPDQLERRGSSVEDVLLLLNKYTDGYTKFTDQNKREIEKSSNTLDAENNVEANSMLVFRL